MIELPVWVRARDGAFYKNPVLICPEGFVRFRFPSTHELVVWTAEPAKEPSQDATAAASAVDILARLLGPDGWMLPADSAGLACECEIPGVEPPARQPATVFRIVVSRRIPRPELHEGCERYPRRMNGATLDWPMDSRDPYQLAGNA